MLTIALAGSHDQRERWVEAIDMRAPGVTVDPLRGMTGHAHLNEVFFDDVFVPDSDVVGDVNRGWLVASATLGNERISIGGGWSAPTGFTADDVIKLLDNRPADTAASYHRRAGEAIPKGATACGCSTCAG